MSKSRGQTFDSVLRAAEVDQSEIEVAGPSALRRLAPMLGVHPADLLVLAGLDVPSDLAPCAAPVGSILDHLVKTALRLPVEQREHLLGAARSMPLPESAAPIVRGRDPFPYGPGAVIVRLLRNRNLDSLNSAKMVYRLAGIGPLSAATINVVGLGRKKLDPQLLFAFATVLSYRVEDLAALLDIELPQTLPPADTASRQVAELIWEARHLSADRLRALQEKLVPAV
ncbi:XRE family transcriptional regulator [Micromonospora sp. NPDC002411]